MTSDQAAASSSSISKKSWESNKGQDEVLDRAQQLQQNLKNFDFDGEKARLFHARNAEEALRRLKEKKDRESSFQMDPKPISPELFKDSLSHKQQTMDMESVTLDDDEAVEALDSLQQVVEDAARKTPKINLQPDSLSYEEEAFNRASLEFFDSISSNETKRRTTTATLTASQGQTKQSNNKKLIIPYLPDSFSSNTSVFTSQDDEEEEEDSIDNAARTVDEDENGCSLEAPSNKNNNPSFARRLPHNYANPMHPQMIINQNQPRPLSANPMASRQQLIRPQNRLLPTTPTNLKSPMMGVGGSQPDLTRRYSPLEKRLSPLERQFSPLDHHHPQTGVLRDQPGIASTATTNTAMNLAERANNQSLVRMATERMKRKFLGWN